MRASGLAANSERTREKTPVAASTVVVAAAASGRWLTAATATKAVFPIVFHLYKFYTGYTLQHFSRFVIYTVVSTQVAGVVIGYFLV